MMIMMMMLMVLLPRVAPPKMFLIEVILIEGMYDGNSSSLQSTDYCTAVDDQWFRLNLFTHGLIPCSNGSLGYQEKIFMLYTKQIMNYKTSNFGYDDEKHFKFATLSSGSPVTLELRLFITLRILSGASYLDMIWCAVDVNTVPSIFWATICDIDEALDNINVPSDADGMAQLVDNWAKKRENDKV
jgi:hypothetical protein